MDEKILNSLTGRYVKKTGKIGKKILLNKIEKNTNFYVNDIIPIIGKYFIEPKYTKFKDFVNLKKISWKMLCQNPNAFPLLEHNMDKINWKTLSRNPNAILLLEQNMNKINWVELSGNPNAIHLLKQKTNKINCKEFSRNPNAIRMLEFNIFSSIVSIVHHHK